MNRRAALAVGAANLLGRVSGLARDVLFAAVFGAGATSDAYNAALRVPQLLRELTAEGSLQNVVVPAFSETIEKEGLDAAWRLANAVLGVLLLFLGVATATFWLGAELWVRLVAEGFAADPPKLALATQLTRWLSPFLAGLSLAAFFGGLLNVRGKFFVPAMAQNVLNLAVIAACLGGAKVEAATGAPAIVVVAAATTISGFVQVLFCVPPLWRAGFRFTPTFRGHPALGRLLVYFGTAFVGVVTVQFNLLVESQYASRFGDGVLTWLLGSFRLVQLPLALVAGSLATAMLPQLSGHLARGERDAAGGALASTLRTHAFLVVPAAVGLGVLAEPIVRLVYERGAFDHADTVGTANMLRMYAFACYGICLHRLLVPVFYALNRPRFPMWLSLGAMAAKVPVVWLLTGVFAMGAEALPLSHAVTVSVEVLGLAWGVREVVGGRGLGGYHVKLAFAAGVMGWVAWQLAPRLPVLLVVAAAGGVYLVLGAMLGVLALPAWKRPLIPPFVDPETARWLEAARVGVEVTEAGLRIEGTTVFVVVIDGQLALRTAAGAPCATSVGEASALRIGIEPGREPKIVALEAGGRRWHVRATALAEGPPVWLDLPPSPSR